MWSKETVILLCHLRHIKFWQGFSSHVTCSHILTETFQKTTNLGPKQMHQNHANRIRIANCLLLFAEGGIIKLKKKKKKNPPH